MTASKAIFTLLAFVFLSVPFSHADEEQDKKDVATKKASAEKSDAKEADAPKPVNLVPDPELRKVILEIKRRRQVDGEEITMEDLKNVWSLDA
ncbi:MAG: hypothetical protein N2B57_03315, partial [Planctomycetales bacterium]